MNRIVIFVAFAVVFVAVFADNAKTDNIATVDKAGKIILAKSTTSLTFVSLFTSTVFSSCLRSITAVKCSGKKRRRRNAHIELVKKIETEDDSVISPSQEQSDGYGLRNTSPGENREGKFKAITIWSTTRVSTTVTIITTNPDTTLSLIYLCTGAGIELPAYSCLT